MATEVASIYARVGADLSGFQSGMGVFNMSINSAGGLFRNFTTGIVQGIGQAFGVAAIRAIREFGDVITGVIGSAADMEQGVADIAAVMQLTGDETAKVSDLVSNLGLDPKLKVTTMEAASAVQMLGKNGVDLDEILKGAARSTVLLSNATGTDFSASAAIATSAMRSFGIGADDMGGAINQIIGVVQNSKLDMNDYRLAISQAGGIAGAVGVEFDDFNAILASTAHLFGSGSDQGTAFKTFLQRLVPQSLEAADAMRDLGLFTGMTGKEFKDTQAKIVETQEAIANLDPTSKNYSEQATKLSTELTALRSELNKGSNAFFDASGAMKSTGEISQRLRDAFSGLSEEQKISAATTIFGTDAMRMAFAMADAGTTVITEMKTAIGNTDAEKSAAIRMDTLSGAWEIFRGIVESLSIKIGTAFLPAMRDIVAVMTDLSGKIGPQVTAWGQQLGEKLSAVTKAGAELIGIGLDKGFASLIAPLGDGTRELDKLWVAFGMTKDGAKEFTQSILDGIATIKDIIGALGGFIGAVKSVVGPVAEFVKNTLGLENALKLVGAVMIGSFIASVVSTIATIVSAVGSVATFVGALTGLSSVATAVGGAVIAAISAIGGPITLVIAAIVALALAWRNNWFDIRGITKTVLDDIQKFFFEGGWRNAGSAMMRGIVDGIQAGWGWIKEAIGGALSGLGAMAVGAAQDLMLGLVNGIRDRMKWVTDIGGDLSRSVLDPIKRALGIASPSKVFAEIGKNIAIGMANGIASGKTLVTGSMADVAQNLTAAWNKQTDEWRISAIEHLRPILADLRNQFHVFEDASITTKENGSALGIDQLVAVINQMSHDLRVSFVNGLSPDTRQQILQDHRIFEDGSIGQRKIEVTIRGESNLPTDKAKLRELARALQQEFVFSGARVAVA